MKNVGKFLQGTKEYVITNMMPKRRLYNYLWNEEIFSKVDQFCCGETLAGFGSTRREFSGDERFVYIKDLKDGSFYSPNRNFCNEPFDVFECIVGIGYQKVISEYKGIRTEYCMTIPSQDKAEIIQISLENKTNEIKRLHVYTYNAVNANTSNHIAYGHS